MTNITNKRRWYHLPLIPITFILSWFYICTFLMVFSFFANAFWIIKMIAEGTLLLSKKELANIRKRMKTLSDLECEYKVYSYEYDGITKGGLFKMWPTWIPLPVVFIAKDRKDNCDGSSMWLKWLFRQLKKENKNYVSLTAKQKIYVPLLPWKLNKVHYIAIIKDNDLKTYRCYSSGRVTNETYDELALRLLEGDQRYMWIQ